MGELTKIQKGKTSDDARKGCAPVDWLAQKATDFAKGFFEFSKDVGLGIQETYKEYEWLFAPIGIPLAGLAGLVGGAFGAAKSVVSYGVTVIKGGIQALGGCAKLVGIAAGGAVALAGGIAAASALSAGGITSAIAGLATTALIGVLLRAFVRSVTYFWNFNWNITDKEIRAQQKSSLEQLAGTAGGALGTMLGNLLCGSVPGAAILRFNPAAIAAITEINEDVKDEIMSSFKNLLNQTVRTAQSLAFFEIYKNARAFIKKFARNPKIQSLLPAKIDNAIKAWGEEGSKPFTFAGKVQDFIEKIDNKALQNFTEELWEELADSCQEKLIAVSYAF